MTEELHNGGGHDTRAEPIPEPDYKKMTPDAMIGMATEFSRIAANAALESRGLVVEAMRDNRAFRLGVTAEVADVTRRVDALTKAMGHEPLPSATPMRPRMPSLVDDDLEPAERTANGTTTAWKVPVDQLATYRDTAVRHALEREEVVTTERIQAAVASALTQQAYVRDAETWRETKSRGRTSLWTIIVSTITLAIAAVAAKLKHLF